MIPSVSRMPRVILGEYPTPLVEAKVLSKALGGPRILIKREDLSGLALGGNKCRHIEFLLGHVKNKGYDMVLCGGGTRPGSYGIQLLAASKKADVEIRLYSRRDPSERLGTSGNVLLQQILEPHVTWVDCDPPEGGKNDLAAFVMEEARRLEKEGHRPYLMQTVFINETPIEQAGWVNVADEISGQLGQRSIRADYLVIANGQGGTQAGLMVGAKAIGAPFKVIGMCIMFRRIRQIREMVRMTNETSRFLNLGVSFEEDEMELYDDYAGEQYGAVTEACVEAIRLMAQTEGIFLDPLYTGKAMAGLIDLTRKSRFTSKDTVVFIHTGGTPDIFYYGEQLLALMKQKRR